MSQIGWAICLRHPEPFVKFRLSTPATAQPFWEPPKGPFPALSGEREGELGKAQNLWASLQSGEGVFCHQLVRHLAPLSLACLQPTLSLVTGKSTRPS